MITIDKDTYPNNNSMKAVSGKGLMAAIQQIIKHENGAKDCAISPDTPVNQLFSASAMFQMQALMQVEGPEDES